MNSAEQSNSEVRLLEYNAKEAGRMVALGWVVRKVAWPLGFFFCALIASAWYTSGLVAGLISALVFLGPLVLIVGFTTGQFRKVLEYWTK